MERASSERSFEEDEFSTLGVSLEQSVWEDQRYSACKLPSTQVGSIESGFTIISGCEMILEEMQGQWFN